jgi:hypothetical protein
VCIFPYDVDGINEGKVALNKSLVCLRGDMPSIDEGNGMDFPEILTTGVLVFWWLLPDLTLGMAPPVAEQ